jgi:hypothetical protein
VDVTGIEPATPCLQSRMDKKTKLFLVLHYCTIALKPVGGCGDVADDVE